MKRVNWITNFIHCEYLVIAHYVSAFKQCLLLSVHQFSSDFAVQEACNMIFFVVDCSYVRGSVMQWLPRPHIDIMSSRPGRTFLFSTLETVYLLGLG